MGCRSTGSRAVGCVQGPAHMFLSAVTGSSHANPPAHSALSAALTALAKSVRAAWLVDICVRSVQSCAGCL